LSAAVLRKYWRLPRRRKILLPEALLAVIVASVLLKVLRFSIVAAWLGGSRNLPDGTPTTAQSLDVGQRIGQDISQDIGWSVRAAAARVPWPAQCLVQALAAAFLAKLHRLRTVLYLGVTRSETGQLQAHAWLRCGDRIITGAPSHEKFRVVATFSP
jgi:hypothetical protein